jgi:hypothetical protein
MLHMLNFFKHELGNKFYHIGMYHENEESGEVE